MAILQRKVSAQRCTITRVFYTILIITPWLFFFCICVHVCIPTNSHVLGIKKLQSQVSPHQLTNSSHLAEKFELIHPLTFRREVLETRLCFHVLGSLELFGTAFEVFGLSPDMIRFSIKNPGTCRIKISHPWLKKGWQIYVCCMCKYMLVALASLFIWCFTIIIFRMQQMR